jgi:hypothetical protein
VEVQSSVADVEINEVAKIHAFLAGTLFSWRGSIENNGLIMGSISLSTGSILENKVWSCGRISMGRKSNFHGALWVTNTTCSFKNSLRTRKRAWGSDYQAKARY